MMLGTQGSTHIEYNDPPFLLFSYLPNSLVSIQKLLLESDTDIFWLLLFTDVFFKYGNDHNIFGAL